MKKRYGNYLSPMWRQKESVSVLSRVLYSAVGSILWGAGELNNTSHLGEEGPRSVDCRAVSLVAERWGGRG